MADESYMVLDCEPPLGRDFAYYEHSNSSSKRSWHAGRPFETPEEQPYKGFQHPSEPVEVTVEDRGLYAEYWEHPVPLMTKRLHQVLTDAGVDNLQTYEAVIHNSGSDNSDYVAWNLVGTVSETQLSDSDAANNPLLFRLGESTAIMVHRTVVERIKSAGIDTVHFLPLGKSGG